MLELENACLPSLSCNKADPGSAAAQRWTQWEFSWLLVDLLGGEGEGEEGQPYLTGKWEQRCELELGCGAVLLERDHEFKFTAPTTSAF